MAFWQWSRTASNDATADPTIGWSEGMAPSAVNDSARAMMARLAENRDDISGLLTTGGTSTSYTLSTFQLAGGNGLAATPNDGQLIAFSPHAVNGIAPTLTVDGGTTYPIQSSPGVAISAASLVTGSPYSAKFSLSNLSWILFGFYANPFNIPLACGMDFWGPSIPNSNFAFPAGQAISRTTYSTLFGLIGTTYGTGDGINTFNLPDKTGRVSAMRETVISRLTAAYFGGTSSNLGAVGGFESETLTLAQLPTNITVTGTVTVNPSGNNGLFVPVNNTFWTSINATSGGTTAVAASGGNAAVSGVNQFSGTNTLTSNNTSGNPHANVQPTIICNYIMRII